ncbi:sulfocyanin-like copper-binding protein [Streptomyces sp. NPDC059340]|uniref:sulfocyanin-like copper-binding protein n=1 Tax=Streptomyces sp. NPDC059340 TaxID=3346806 RepID=UPI0036B1FC1D
MTAKRRRRVWLPIAGTLVALVLGIATTATLAATGDFRHTAPAGWTTPGARCSPPALSGHVVDVTIGDMMGAMMGGPHGHTPSTGPGRHGMGMMWLRATPSTVAAGTVSLRVFNAGALTHEVVVLPLPAGQAVGERSIGAQGRIAEAGSLGEASRTCAAGEGDGITSGAMAWTTLTLQPGRYELVCNLVGHYAGGMYTELDATR